MLWMVTILPSVIVHSCCERHLIMNIVLTKYNLMRLTSHLLVLHGGVDH